MLTFTCLSSIWLRFVWQKYKWILENWRVNSLSEGRFLINFMVRVGDYSKGRLIGYYGFEKFHIFTILTPSTFISLLYRNHSHRHTLQTPTIPNTTTPGNTLHSIEIVLDLSGWDSIKIYLNPFTSTWETIYGFL